MCMKVTIDAETKQFQKWIGEYTKALPRDVQPKALRAMALEFVSRAVKLTPVDTGRARGGWISFMEKETPLPTSVLVRDTSRVGGSSEKVTGAQISKGRSEGGHTTDLKGKDQYVEVLNGVPYIVQLEHGSSDQNPTGMVRVAFREMQGKADDIFLKELEKANRKATAKSRGIRG